MSFASETKNELTRLPVHPAHAKAELAAIIRMNGAISLYNGQFILNVQTENAAIARRLYSLIQDVFQIDSELLVRRKMKLKKNNVYIVRVTSQASMILSELDIMDGMQINHHIPEHLRNDPELRRSYLRGAFLATGSINNPESSSYHLEIYSNYETHSEELKQLLDLYEFKARTIERRNGSIVYIKEAEKIGDFLALIGAINARLMFENIRIVRDLRNSANRLVNCEVANLNKVAKAAAQQIQNIQLIDETIGIDQLPLRLQQMAKIRLAEPDMTLTELGQYIEDGPISKSGINHRLRKLNEWADKIRRERENKE
ncbi:DNA-binding protein WhiA [Atopobacter phocae]|uniref:DNA-binding protein WhiA n=1 Tax=Atopobacter phocae TaxID=136492 RepID=UPI000470837C|nr:DNA-binding protein WhiA [Atopobacter phocae]